MAYNNSMTVYLAVLAAVLVAAVVAAIAYVIATLIQLKRTAAELELLIRKANSEMDKVERVTSAVSGFAEILGGSTGRLVTGAAQVVFDLFRRHRRRKAEESPEGEDPS